MIVPELGGFVTEYRPAHIDEAHNIIHPPSKDLRFNTNLKKNDGLLADAISRSREISHEEANSLIKQQVESYFTSLNNGLRVEFDKVGVLYLDSHKNMRFIPEESMNYLLESFSLKKIRAIKPLAIPELMPEIILQAKEVVEEPEEVAPVVLEKVEKDAVPIEAPIIDIQEKRSPARWMAAALIPLFFLIGYVMIQSKVLRDGDIHFSELDPFSDSVSSFYVERDAPTEINVELEEAPTTINDGIVLIEGGDAIPVFEKPVTPIIKAEAVNTYVAPASIKELKYHIIGGCFSMLHNAEGLVDQLRTKGFESFILDQRKGLYRVVYSSHESRSTAIRELNAIKRTQRDAWLLRMN